MTSGNFCYLLITYANSLELDQDRQNVGPDLDPNSLTHSVPVLFFEKVTSINSLPTSGNFCHLSITLNLQTVLNLISNLQRKDGQPKSQIAPLFQSGAIMTFVTRDSESVKYFKQLFPLQARFKITLSLMALSW